MNAWIRVDVDLPRKPKFLALADDIGEPDRFRVVGYLVSLWSWLQAYGTEIELQPGAVERAIGLPSGFVESLVRVGWADAADGRISFRFNGTTTPEIRAVRSDAGKRGAEARWQTNGKPMANGCQTKTKTKRERERNTEETASAVSFPVTDETPATGTTRTRTASVQWGEANGFEGVTDSMRNAWRVAAPLADIDAELARAHVWLIGQPAARRKRDYRRFLTNWFLRAQEMRASTGGVAGQTTRGTLPYGCRRDANGIVRTPSGAALEGFE